MRYLQSGKGHLGVRCRDIDLGVVENRANGEFALDVFRYSPRDRAGAASAVPQLEGVNFISLLVEKLHFGRLHSPAARSLDDLYLFSRFVGKFEKEHDGLVPHDPVSDASVVFGVRVASGGTGKNEIGARGEYQ